MREHLLHYLPLYQEYIRVFGSSLPHLSAIHLPHEAQQQLNFIYLLQIAKDAGFIDATIYYVPIKPNHNMFGCADGLILDSCINKVVSVQHKYLTHLNYNTITTMIQQYQPTTGILNITVDNVHLLEQYKTFVKTQLLENMRVFLDVHSPQIDEAIFYKGVSSTNTFLLQRDYGNLSNYQYINDNYAYNPKEYMAVHSEDNAITYKIKNLFTTEL